MQGAEERRLRRMRNTLQGGALEGNAADDAWMVDQGSISRLTSKCGWLNNKIASQFYYQLSFLKGRILIWRMQKVFWRPGT